MVWRTPHLCVSSEARKLGHGHECSSFYYWIWYLKLTKPEAYWQVSLYVSHGDLTAGGEKLNFLGDPFVESFWLHNLSSAVLILLTALFSLLFLPPPFSSILSFVDFFFFNFLTSYQVSSVSPSLYFPCYLCDSPHVPSFFFLFFLLHLRWSWSQGYSFLIILNLAHRWLANINIYTNFKRYTFLVHWIFLSLWNVLLYFSDWFLP